MKNNEKKNPDTNGLSSIKLSSVNMEPFQFFYYRVYLQRISKNSPSEKHHHEPEARTRIGRQFIFHDPCGRLFVRAVVVCNATGNARHQKEVRNQENEFWSIASLEQMKLS